MVSANTKPLIDPTEHIRHAVHSLDSATSVLCEESHTKDGRLAKIVERIGRVKSRLSSVPDSASHGISSTIDSCIDMLDDAIRLAKEAPVVSSRQAQFIRSIHQIQSHLYSLTPNRRSHPEPPPPVPSSAHRDPIKDGGEPPANKNLRQRKRVPLETDVDFVGDTNFYTGFVEDVSSGGLYVSTFNLQPIGTHIELSFTLPNGHHIKVPGQVRWVRDPIIPDENSSPGMGIMFEKLEPEDKKQIEAFIAGRSPLFYDEDI